MREEVLSHRFRIRKFGQVVHFQMKLPADTHRIVGIETSAIRRHTELAQYVPATFMMNGIGGDPDPMPPLFRIDKGDSVGRLTLRVLNSAGIFYQEDVRQRDDNWSYADHSTLLVSFFDYTHRGKRTESGVAVNGCLPIIEGHYKDTWGVLESFDVTYDLSVYVWIEKLLQ